LHRRMSTATRAGLSCGIVLLALLVVRNWEMLFSRRWEDGDFALNSILIDRARHFELLVGNYSRVGFNHPGPALLYVQAWSQLLFRDAIPVFASPFGAQLFGILVLNSVLAGLSATTIVRRTGQRFAPVLLLVCILAYSWKNPGLVASTWMPNVYVWPFLLLLVSAASVASGEARDSWKLFLADGLLIHGHVSFVLFAVGFTVVAGAALLARRMDLPAATRRFVAISCGTVISLFALPIVVNTAFNYPGEVDDYIRYSRSDQAGGHGLRPAVAFVRNYWAEGRNGGLVAVGFFVAACVAISRIRGRPGQRFMTALMGMILVATALTVVYAMRGVDDLALSYLAIFYTAVPLLTLVAVGIAIIDTCDTVHWRNALAASLIALLVVLAFQPGLENPYPGAPWVPSATNELVASGPAPIHLRFELKYWPQAAGLVEETRRRGIAICVEQAAPIYRTLFTKGMICSADDLGRGTSLEITDPGVATGNVLYSNAEFALKPVAP
jgi:hypothetical protein